jgi:dihydroorotate dehydrogenase (fumarate)
MSLKRSQRTWTTAKLSIDEGEYPMDLTTRYLRLNLKCPIVASASPLTGSLDNIRRLEDFGAGAVVLPSIFQEQIEQEQQLIDRLATTGADSYAEALTYFPVVSSYGMSPDSYLETLRLASQSVDIPVIASLNGITDQGWIEYARKMEQAGADALELNIYFIPADLATPGREVEDRYLSILRAVKQAVKIPVAVKLGPYFSAMGHMARQLAESGADGLVLFNRFYEPDINLTELTLAPNLELSTPAEIRLPLLWIAVLSGQTALSLAASTGVENTDEVVKYLLAGADVVMTTSALLRHGLGHIQVLLEGLKSWLAERDLSTLDGIRGRMSQCNIADPTAFVRANYIRILQGYPSQS